MQDFVGKLAHTLFNCGTNITILDVCGSKLKLSTNLGHTRVLGHRVESTASFVQLTTKKQRERGKAGLAYSVF